MEEAASGGSYGSPMSPEEGDARQGRGRWPIPLKEQILNSGEEWLLHPLALHPSEVRDMIIMIIWRIWNLRSDLVHGRSIPPTKVSKNFLCSYVSSLRDVKHLSTEQSLKGKSPVDTLCISDVKNLKGKCRKMLVLAPRR